MLTIAVFITSSLVFIISVWLYRNHIRENNRNTANLSRKTVHINGMASSFPNNTYSQIQMRDMFIKNYCRGSENVTDDDLKFIHRVFAAALIEKCHVNLPEDELFRRMKREDYTLYVKSTIINMACRAVNSAILVSSDVKLDKITHLVCGTMTATIAAPSIDVLIAKELELNPNVKRLNVEAMGCLTGFRLMGLCRDIALQSPTNVVLLIVGDVRSALGNQLTPFAPMEPIDKSNVIISALFRDACGAAIFSQTKSRENCSIVDHRSSIIDNTLELGRLKEFNDSSIHLYLDKRLPYAVFDAVPGIVHQLLNDHNLNIVECQFAVHTGGPKIIRGIQQCLDLLDEQLCASWFILLNYGNLSGSSNLVVVEHFLRWKYSDEKPIHSNIAFPKDYSKYKYVIGLSFGPGIATECVLIRME